MSFGSGFFKGIIGLLKFVTLGFIKSVKMRFHLLGIMIFGILLLYDSLVILFKEGELTPLFIAIGKLFLGVDLLIRQETVSYLTDPVFITAINLIGALFFFYFLHKWIFKLIRGNNTSAVSWNVFFSVIVVFLIMTGYGSAVVSAEEEELSIVFGYTGFYFFLTQIGNILDPGIDTLRDFKNTTTGALPEINATSYPRVKIELFK